MKTATSATQEIGGIYCRSRRGHVGLRVRGYRGVEVLSVLHAVSSGNHWVECNYSTPLAIDEKVSVLFRSSRNTTLYPCIPDVYRNVEAVRPSLTTHLTIFTMTDLWQEYRDKLVGCWKCLSFDLLDSSKPDTTILTSPLGKIPAGRMIITREGFFSAILANPDHLQPLPSGKRWHEGKDEEVANVARMAGAYCGHLTLFKDDEGLCWRTKVEASSGSSILGHDEVRKFKFDDTHEVPRLVLRLPSEIRMPVSFGPFLVRRP